MPLTFEEFFLFDATEHLLIQKWNDVAFFFFPPSNRVPFYKIYLLVLMLQFSNSIYTIFSILLAAKELYILIT